MYGRPRSNLTACFSFADGIFRFSQKACPSSAKTQMRRFPSSRFPTSRFSLPRFPLFPLPHSPGPYDAR